MHQVVTGEAVALDLRPAGLPSRFVAGLIDAVIQFAAFFGLFAVGAAVQPGLSGAASATVLLLIAVACLIGYPVALESAFRGRTPGKAAMGLRVVRDDGGPIGFRHALARGLAGAFLERGGVTFFVGALVTMLLHPQSKRIGDLLAGTLVLQERVAARGAPMAQMPPPLAAWAAGADLSGVSDDLAMSARSFLTRSAELSDAAREDVGGRLVRAVLAATSPPPPPGTPGWAVLSALLAERRRRAEAVAWGQPTAALAAEPAAERTVLPGAAEPEPPVPGGPFAPPG